MRLQCILKDLHGRVRLSEDDKNRLLIEKSGLEQKIKELQIALQTIQDRLKQESVDSQRLKDLNDQLLRLADARSACQPQIHEPRAPIDTRILQNEILSRPPAINPSLGVGLNPHLMNPFHVPPVY